MLPGLAQVVLAGPGPHVPVPVGREPMPQQTALPTGPTQALLSHSEFAPQAVPATFFA